MQSILESKVVSLTYTQYGRTELHLQFNEIFYRDGIWFSSAYDIFAEQWGTYRCDYMVDVVLEERFKHTYTLAELDEFQKTYESEFHNIPFRCRLTQFGKESFLKHRYPNMELEEVDGIFYMTGGYHEDRTYPGSSKQNPELWLFTDCPLWDLRKRACSPSNWEKAMLCATESSTGSAP